MKPRFTPGLVVVASRQMFTITGALQLDNGLWVYKGLTGKGNAIYKSNIQWVLNNGYWVDAKTWNGPRKLDENTGIVILDAPKDPDEEKFIKEAREQWLKKEKV